MSRLMGTIKSFKNGNGNRTGYGFIIADSGADKDIYFHVKMLSGFPKVREIETGARVSFILEKHERGLRALDVKQVIA